MTNLYFRDSTTETRVRLQLIEMMQMILKELALKVSIGIFQNMSLTQMIQRKRIHMLQRTSKNLENELLRKGDQSVRIPTRITPQNMYIRKEIFLTQSLLSLILITIQSIPILIS